MESRPQANAKTDDPRPSAASKHRPEYRVVVPLPRTDADGKERTYWHEIGCGFLNRQPDGDTYITVKLNSSPIGAELNLFRNDGRPKGSAATS
jgi:hypothetical protein